MQSSNIRLDKRRRTYVRLVGEIRHALNQALAEEGEKRGLTRAGIARLLGKNKSVITRKFAGTSNMTLETLADLAFALDRPVKVSMPAREVTAGSNHFSANAPLVGTTAPRTLIRSNGEGALLAETAA